MGRATHFPESSQRNGAVRAGLQHEARDADSVLRLEHISSAIKDGAMQNRPKTVMSTRHLKPAESFPARPKRWTPSAARTQSHGGQSAQRSYERYLALAQEEARSGNVVAAENYYQHAEHYFRLMSPSRKTT